MSEHIDEGEAEVDGWEDWRILIQKCVSHSVVYDRNPLGRANNREILVVVSVKSIRYLYPCSLLL